MQLTGRVLESKDIPGLSSGVLLRVLIIDDGVVSHVGQERYVFVPASLNTISHTFQPPPFENMKPEVFRTLQEAARAGQIKKGPKKDFWGEIAKFDQKVTFTGDLLDPWPELGEIQSPVLKGRPSRQS